MNTLPFDLGFYIFSCNIQRILAILFGQVMNLVFALAQEDLEDLML